VIAKGDQTVARKSQFVKLNRKPKFKVRHRNRCPICGRSRGYYRKFKLCRICFRNLASRGELPGVIKASW
jgi:small subunit ribosomal protein S14